MSEDLVGHSLEEKEYIRERFIDAIRYTLSNWGNTSQEQYDEVVEELQDKLRWLHG